MQGAITRPSFCPLVALKSPLSKRVRDQLKCPPVVSFPSKTTLPWIKNKDQVLHVSATSTTMVNNIHQIGFLHNLQLHSHEKRGPCRLRAAKDKLFYFPPYPRMKEKPKWWWRTLACILYLMTFYEHQFWTYAHPTNNPPAFLENFESLTFPLLSAIFALPRLVLSGYACLSWFTIVRQKHWPHFLRFHVMTAILIGSLVQVIGVAGGWFPSRFYPPHFWSAATFAFLVTVLECIRCALAGMYPDVPFVNDAAYLHTYLG